jgi:predicted GNAT family N-acyltransferase
MPATLQFSVVRALWPRDEPLLRGVRTAVFIVEQGVPPELEWDGRDADCLHVLACDVAGAAIGTGRLLPEGKIGRMAVLQAARGRGVGAAILHELMGAARERDFAAVELSAQTHALDFYRKCGFVIVSDEYLDAGILHRTMRCRLAA